ncbi:hypothetical protein O5O45_07045 [Hahella aquimaris]|uniref:hypothetical protein n=1 Tax=Hahella sp. HNIBRBA332 TaxID=3015983 RepID=UPI00273CB64A|nr:hypothetical protein [Hahella sp. HNIBRBA332]WLQ15670.1 hypothetical protein O5O45_07045 [Hahella sp. HNIBRBA332]
MDAKAIIEGIESGDILPKDLILNIDIDAYLDKRDSDEAFERKLLAAFDDVADIDNDQIDGYQELTLKIFNCIDSLVGVSELSCYVAEDFEVILKGIYKGLSNECSGQIPPDTFFREFS